MIWALTSFLATCSTIAAVLLGGTGILILSGFLFYLSFKLARHWLNKLLTDLIDIHGIPKVREAINRIEDEK